MIYEFVNGEQFYTKPTTVSKHLYISMGSFGSSSKHIFAFTCQEVPEQKIQAPDYTIWHSSELESKRKLESSLQETNHEGRNSTNLQKKQRRDSFIDTLKCFFCLSNPKVDKNLIVSIGKDNYLALAKGPLCSKAARDRLGCSGHIILIPLAHVSYYNGITTHADNCRLDSTLAEQQSYCAALQELYNAHDLQMCGFEISRTKKGVHIHRQMFPVDTQEDMWSKVKAQIGQESTKCGLKFTETNDQMPQMNDYIMLFVGPHKLIAHISATQRIDVQFCRRVFSHALSSPNQADWRQCIQTEDEELDDRKKFCELFKGYDTTQ